MLAIGHRLIQSLVKPEKFDWDKLKTADLLIGEEEEEDGSPNIQPKNEEGDLNKEKQAGVEVNFESVETSSLEQQQQKLSSQLTNKELDFWIKIATGAAIFVLLITWVIWPMSVYRDWIFTGTYFKGYVTVGLIWLYTTLIVIGLVPFYTGRHSAATVFRGLYNDYIKRK